MKQISFEGFSDDTFGELTTREDFDNCASGQPIVFKVWSPSENDGLFVVGHYCPGPMTGWMIGVGRLSDDDDKDMPAWPMRVVHAGRTYTPRLDIQAPDDVIVEHVEDD